MFYNAYILYLKPEEENELKNKINCKTYVSWLYLLFSYYSFFFPTIVSSLEKC